MWLGSHHAEMVELGLNPDICALGQALNLHVLMPLSPEGNMLQDRRKNLYKTSKKEQELRAGGQVQNPVKGKQRLTKQGCRMRWKKGACIR